MSKTTISAHIITTLPLKSLVSSNHKFTVRWMLLDHILGLFDFMILCDQNIVFRNKRQRQVWSRCLLKISVECECIHIRNMTSSGSVLLLRVGRAAQSLQDNGYLQGHVFLLCLIEQNMGFLFERSPNLSPQDQRTQTL